jgi:uncharacterized membrane protein YeaQ/YmgE (transglycosylase-associated protein family)
VGLLWTILIGFCIGAVAKFFMPGKGPGGFIITTLLGVAGSWVGSLLLDRRVGFVGSVIGAILILVIYRWFAGRKAST